jgi:hypothetical protein
MYLYFTVLYYTGACTHDMHIIYIYIIQMYASYTKETSISSSTTSVRASKVCDIERGAKVIALNSQEF